MLNEVLQRNVKHEARLSNTSLVWIGTLQHGPEILRFAQNDIAIVIEA